MSYIEARGLGTRLPPNNVGLLAKQNYWADIACSEVGPHVEAIVQQLVLAPMSNIEPDKQALQQARSALSAPLEAFAFDFSQQTGRAVRLGQLLLLPA